MRKGWVVRALVSASVLAGAVALGTNAWAWYPYSDRYETWQANRPLTMGAWHNSVPRDHLPERVKRFRAAGLNTFFWVKPANATHFFQAAQEHGLEWQCGMRCSREEFQEVLRIPGCSAVIVDDEPSIRGKTEEEQAQLYTELKERIAWVHENYPPLLAFVNLSIMKIDLDRYVETCGPDIFSYDMYPLHRNGTTHSKYLYLLGVARETAQRHRLPFWMILQAYGREHEKPDYAYRIPDEADMRFLIFTFLAHGGVGFHLFHYYGHPEAMVFDRGMAEPGRAPVEEHVYEDTLVTRAYYAVRDVAPEVQVLGRALLNLRSKGAIGYAGEAPDQCGPFAPSGPLRGVEMLDEARAPLLVAYFDDREGEEYFMVVNLNHGADLSKTDAAGTVRLTFGEEVEHVERLNRLTGDVEVLATIGAGDGARILDVMLEGGTGDLFHWHTGRPWALRAR